MNAPAELAVIQQHLIDPEICIRCNTCESICPVGAITHDSRNYVVDASKCNLCMDCISPCPTGSIDNWRTMPLVRAYTPEEQLTWNELPAELPPEELEGLTDAGADVAVARAPAAAPAKREPLIQLPPRADPTRSQEQPDLALCHREDRALVQVVQDRSLSEELRNLLSKLLCNHMSLN